MTKDGVAGFMLGMSAGVAIGYFLKPHHESDVYMGGHARSLNGESKQPRDRARRPESNNRELGEDVAPRRMRHN